MDHDLLERDLDAGFIHADLELTVHGAGARIDIFFLDFSNKAEVDGGGIEGLYTKILRRGGKEGMAAAMPFKISSVSARLAA